MKTEYVDRSMMVIEELEDDAIRIEALKIHGFIKGSYLGIKRLMSCHPFKFLGGGSGLNFVPKKKNS